MYRWRGRSGGLATMALITAASALVAAVALVGARPESGPASEPGTAWQLVARAENDTVLLRVALPDGRFTLRYRNSVYGSLAEERFSIDADGRMVLVEVAADEAAVLDEYYAASRPLLTDEGDARRWRAAPESPLALEQLALAATQHGQRTLVVEGATIPLWQLAANQAGTTALVLAAEQAR